MITLFSLLIVVAYVVISIAVIVVVGKKKSAKAAGIVAWALFLLGTWDVILGRAALYYECEFNVVSEFPNEKIALSDKYFDRYGRVDWNTVKKETSYSTVYKFSSLVPWLGLEELNATVFDSTKNVAIARKTNFLVSAGWLESGLSPSKKSCEAKEQSLDSIFVPVLKSISPN